MKHGLRTTVRRARTTAGFLILVFGLLSGFYPPLRTFVVQQAATVKQQVRGVADSALTPIRPVAVQGSGSTTNHPPNAAFDTFANTSWQVPWNEKAPARLTVQLDRAVALRKILVRTGDSKNFAGSSRPATLELKYSNEKSELISLVDKPDPQEIALRNAVGVGTITITVVTVFPAPGARDLAVAEIELFGIG
ncbi:hypothetical protein FB561_0443 [Kribbella amoyensis]|uniref:F5/8 type C domain-containing protein n=1 Tax=Kribbella amoyensis TaxID=996641 RepID=A0A561BKK4_9ACTN|nr:hypothetical protein FB561_0443 [Kribbella amoyensis]